VIVTFAELAAALEPAVSVIACVAPGVNVADAGLAVTPAGNPEIVIAIRALYPLTAVVVTVIDCVAPPAVNARLAGAADTVKSSTVLVAFELHPTAVSAKQLSSTKPSSQSPALTCRAPNLFRKAARRLSPCVISTVAVRLVARRCGERGPRRASSARWDAEAPVFLTLVVACFLLSGPGCRFLVRFSVVCM
jgi:hypothetical protein